MKNRTVKILTAITLAIILSSYAAQIATFSTQASANRATSQPQPLTTVVNGNLTNTSLHDAGATFPNPLISSQWIPQFHAAFPNDTVYYRSVGSGAGIASLINKTGDLAQSDAPLNAAQRILAPNVLHIPDTIGSVVPAYNLVGAGILTGLNFTGDVLARIYLGNITTWNDARIQSLNPGVTLPANPIQTVHRSDSSGTTFVWTSFLCLESATWCATVGKGTGGTGFPWPVGIGASGNPGVAQFVNNTANTIGYVELNYALTGGHNTFGKVQNPAGNFILPSLTSTQYAVANATGSLPQGNGDWSAVSLLNELGASTYPIASFSYALVYRELNVLPSMNINETSQAHELTRFLNWIITTGQSYSAGLFYVPLPANVVALDQASINMITYTTFETPKTTSAHLTGNAGTGWNATHPGPTFSVVSGDTINFNFLSSDGLQHQFYVDFTGNSALDPIEQATASPVFSSTTVNTPFQFTPAIGLNVPSAGTFTYRCSFHPSMSGTISISRQQTVVFFHPPSTLTSSLSPVFDTSRVTIIGSIIVGTRTTTLSGNITIGAVDSVSGSIKFAKSYALPNVGLINGKRRIVVNAVVLPYTLSANLLVQSLGGPVTAKVDTLTRTVDIAQIGLVDIVDVATCAFAFGTMIGQPRYNPRADFEADGSIDITDVAFIALYFDTISLT